MDFHGNINLLNNEMQKMVWQQEATFPETPIVGRIAFVQKKAWICVEILSGLPVWVQLTNEIDTYVHRQDTAALTWTVTHNLNTVNPVVQIYDDEHKMIIPDRVEPIDNNSVLITLAVANTGTAVVMYGDITGGSASEAAYTHTQTNPATSWVIPHNLGYFPVVRVFVGNNEIQPTSIVHDSIFQTTITFATVQTGIARLV